MTTKPYRLADHNYSQLAKDVRAHLETLGHKPNKVLVRRESHDGERWVSVTVNDTDIKEGGLDPMLMDFARSKGFLHAGSVRIKYTPSPSREDKFVWMSDVYMTANELSQDATVSRLPIGDSDCYLFLVADLDASYGVVSKKGRVFFTNSLDEVCSWLLEEAGPCSS